MYFHKIIALFLYQFYHDCLFKAIEIFWSKIFVFKRLLAHWFLYMLSEHNLWFSNDFRRYRKWSVAWNKLISIFSWEQIRFINFTVIIDNENGKADKTIIFICISLNVMIFMLKWSCLTFTKFSLLFLTI